MVMDGSQKLEITEVSEDGKSVAPDDVANKYVTQLGAIVRDNVLISFTKWRGKRNDLDTLPQIEKDMLWE